MIAQLALRAPDIVSVRVPLGLALRDVSDLGLVRDDLVVTAVDTVGRSASLSPAASGVYTAPRLPGLGPDLAATPEDWPANARPFEIRITDPRGRYLPVRFTAPLPATARLACPGFAAIPAAVRASLLPPGAPTGFVPDYVPLFPATARIAAGSRAEVRAHLAVGTPAAARDAAHAVMTVSIAGRIRGIGVADARGAVLVSFAYPLLPTPTPAERAAGTTRIEWPVTIAVHYAGLGDDPPLDAILAQLARPASRALARTGSNTRLPVQTLAAGRPLIVRTARPAPALSSTLFIVPA